MADVFLSYAQADAKRAKQIADALEAKGWTVWWDVSLVAGDRFRSKIAEQLHTARCVVVLWSQKAIESDWVIDEADDGKRRGVLVQALIGDVLPPHGFRQIHLARLIEWDGSDSGEFARLCGGVARYAPFTPKPPVPDTPIGKGAWAIVDPSGQREGQGTTVDVSTVASERADRPWISSMYAGHQVALPRHASLEHPARIVWKPIRAGLAFDVTNLLPNVMNGVRLVLKDVPLWDAESSAFVHSNDARGLLEYPLHGPRQLSIGAPTVFWFIHYSPGDSLVVIEGPPGFAKQALSQTGRWKVNLQLIWDGGTHEQSLEFFWDGHNMPTPLLDASPQAAQVDSLSLSADARRATSEQWLDLERRFRELDDPPLRAPVFNDIRTEPRRWKVVGGSEKFRREFNVVAELAGALLLKSSKTWAKISDPDVLESPRSTQRWLFFLLGTGTTTDQYLYDSADRRYARVDEIDNLAEASAKACSECSAYEASV